MQGLGGEARLNLRAAELGQDHQLNLVSLETLKQFQREEGVIFVS